MKNSFVVIMALGLCAQGYASQSEVDLYLEHLTNNCGEERVDEIGNKLRTLHDLGSEGTILACLLAAAKTPETVQIRDRAIQNNQSLLLEAGLIEEEGEALDPVVFTVASHAIVGFGPNVQCRWTFADIKEFASDDFATYKSLKDHGVLPEDRVKKQPRARLSDTINTESKEYKETLAMIARIKASIEKGA